MRKLCACRLYRRALFVVLSIGLLCLMAPGSAPGGQIKTGERARAYIIGKGPDVLVLDMHGFKNLGTNRLAVPYNPMIYDSDGTALTLQGLKIPCEGYVEYKRIRGKKPQLYRLEIESYGDEADSLFTEKKKPKELPR